MKSLLSNVKSAMEQKKNEILKLRRNAPDADYKARSRNMSLLRRQFFKDLEKRPIKNSDTEKRSQLYELNAFMTTSKAWTIEEKNILLDCVKYDSLQRKLEPLMIRMEVLKKQSCMDGDEDGEIENTVNSINQRIKRILDSKDKLYVELDEVDQIDWKKIAEKEFVEKRNLPKTAESCKNFWKNMAHPSINISSWTEDEDENLKKLVEESEGGDWENIAQLLKTGRSAFLCLQRYQSAYNPILQPNWTRLEDIKLEKLVNNEMKTGTVIHWERIEKLFKTKSAEQCEHRWKKLKSTIKIKWTEEMDHKLRYSFIVLGNDWVEIARYLPGKSGTQCSDRYQNCLKDNLKLGNWSPDEDEILLRAVEHHGLKGKWAQISREFLPQRTDNSIGQRYTRLMLHRNKSNIQSVNKTNKGRKRKEQESDDTDISNIPDSRSYSLRKRPHQAIESYDDNDDDDYFDDSSIELGESRAKKLRLKRHSMGANEDEFANQEENGNALTSVNFSKTYYDNEIIKLLKTSIVKNNRLQEYKLEQESKTNFNKEIESLFSGLLDKALDIPIQATGTPLLPPNKFSNQAFEKLLDNRKYLINSAKIFQFPKDVNLPEPLERTQVEKFVETSRTFGSVFLKGEQEVNPKLTGNLFYDKNMATEEDRKNIEIITKILLSTKKEYPDEVLNKHAQANKLYTQIRSSEEYLQLQHKFKSIFFWPLLMKHSIANDALLNKTD